MMVPHAKSAAQFRRRRFDVMADGRRLRVERLELEGSDPETSHLVFLHEGLGSIAQWKGFPAALCAATGLPGGVYERWGFGGSEPLTLPRPRDYLNREAERALPEVLEACAITRPLLIGHSDGGTIALLFAAAFPERPLACITEAAHVWVEEAALAGIRAASTAWRTTDLEARLAKYHGAQSQTVFRGWAETWTQPEFRDWSMVAALPAIVCPLLVIQGLDDEYGTTAQVETIVRQSGGPAAPLLIPGCAHVPHHQAQGSVLEAMSEFIDRIMTGKT
jgi:pimeloyl-ACP methyl ester carboxylesterase